MGNNVVQNTEKENIDIRQLAYAIRFVIAIIALFLTLCCLRSSLAIEGFDRIFKDMLGHELPPLTQAIIRAQPVLVILNIVLPIFVIVCCFLRNLVRSFYYIGVTTLVGIIELTLFYYGLSSVLLQILNAMGANPTS